MQPWKGSKAGEHIFDRKKYGKSERFYLSCLNVSSMSSTQETVPSRAATLPYHDAEFYKFWLNKIACERLGYEELRPFQRELSASIHLDETDVAAFLSTSNSKSALIHIPALLDLELGRKTISLVSVPTKALALDHVHLLVSPFDSARILNTCLSGFVGNKMRP
jgi:hypothetical protein